MRFAADLVLFCTICATLLLDRAISYRRPGWAFARKGIQIVPAVAGARNVLWQRVHWIDASEFARLIDGDPDLVIFRLIDGFLPEIECSEPRGVVAVTVAELEKTVPWIPMSSRIVIYRNGGMSAALARDVATLLHGRDAMFYSGEADPVQAS